MTLRSGIVLCAIVAGLSGLTLCQPPRPRIARVDVPPFPTVESVETKDILTASSRAERIIQVGHPNGPFSPDISHHRLD